MTIKELFFFVSIYFTISLSFLSAQPNRLEIISINNISYISLDSFIQDLNLKSKFFDNNKKIIIYYKKNRIVLSSESSFFLINDDIFHLYTHVIYRNDDFFIPNLMFLIKFIFLQIL